jgi:2-deoxy-D-gluconate 3-dehydrogenase
MSMFDLSGKTALVTGVKRGIGRGMAEALAAAGADIIGVSASLELSGSDVEKAVTGMGRKFTAHQCDFSDRAAVTEFAALVSAEAPDILVNNAGTILRTASLLTFQGGITVPGYAASKGAIGQLTKALANEWAGQGVNVNAIAPGYIATDNTQALQDDPVRSKSILERIPAGRWGAPADFGGPVVFLASSAADYVHGTVLTVDGGWMGR